MPERPEAPEHWGISRDLNRRIGLYSEELEEALE